MVKPGEVCRLSIEKAAAGGPMIARAGGQVVLVTGAIPGEEADVRIDRVAKGVAFGHVVDVTMSSADRRAPSSEPECGGCLYAHIAYERQLALKAEIIADAFGRIAKMPWPHRISVRESPNQGYRMRARLHLRSRQWGFFREGTHTLCDARQTQQLRPDTCEAIEALVGLLEGFRFDDAEIEVSENVDATERAIHVELNDSGAAPADVVLPPGVTGLSASARRMPHRQILAGSPTVHDTLRIDGQAATLSRDVLAFFQGNRYLLHDLVSAVIGAVGEATTIVDLYAGVGLFSVPLAAKGRSVTAVEGDPTSAADLTRNAGPYATALKPRAESVEAFVGRREPRPDAIVVDPPRTGMSKEALRGVVRFGAPRLVYVSCDIATLARDSRALVDAGYTMSELGAFDLFPNTPHVETVAVFRR
jgi:23S rRNA (uracil1939-C5)-methyltransferase